MIRIGLTGMSGSGKSFVSQMFREYKIPTIDSDSLVHELYRGPNRCTDALVRLFGASVLTSDGSINRPVLAEIVFSDPKKLDALNKTVHPFVLEAISDIVDQYEKNGVFAVLIEAPQLFESGLDSTCDYIISVISDFDTRVNRLIARDGISREMAEKRLNHQHPDSFFRDKSDFCIMNTSSDTFGIQKQIVGILEKIGLSV